MEAALRGGDRQVLHERIRRYSLEAQERVAEGGDNPLIDRIVGDSDFRLQRDEVARWIDPAAFTGRSSAQVDEFLDGVVGPLLDEVSTPPRSRRPGSSVWGAFRAPECRILSAAVRHGTIGWMDDVRLLPAGRGMGAHRWLPLVAIALAGISCARPSARLAPGGSVERGVASWYGPDFHGRRTANGERYDMHALTAAHPSLPFDTLVEVRNLDNGRTIRVRINDRGPFKKRRIIDLSFAAANGFDMVANGTARVELVPLGLTAPEFPRFTVQVAAFQEKERADQLAKESSPATTPAPKFGPGTVAPGPDRPLRRPRTRRDLPAATGQPGNRRAGRRPALRSRRCSKHTGRPAVGRTSCARTPGGIGGRFRSGASGLRTGTAQQGDESVGGDLPGGRGSRLPEAPALTARNESRRGPTRRSGRRRSRRSARAGGRGAPARPAWA